MSAFSVHANVRDIVVFFFHTPEEWQKYRDCDREIWIKDVDKMKEAVAKHGGNYDDVVALWKKIDYNLVKKHPEFSRPDDFKRFESVMTDEEKENYAYERYSKSGYSDDLTMKYVVKYLERELRKKKREAKDNYGRFCYYKKLVIDLQKENKFLGFCYEMEKRKNNPVDDCRVLVTTEPDYSAPM